MSVKHGLLTLLDQAPMHGYQLRSAFEESTGATWPINIGQVYTTLARLERDGLIEESQAGAEGQRLYAITETGRAEVAEWFATPVSAEPARNELAIKLALAARTPGADIARIVQIQRAATIKALQDYTRARERAGDDLSWQLVADSLIFTAEAEVRWLDHCETRLHRHRSSIESQRAKPEVAAGAEPSAVATTSKRRS
jgi:DNA-binding PadR family transcriptional regulator